MIKLINFYSPLSSIGTKSKRCNKNNKRLYWRYWVLIAPIFLFCSLISNISSAQTAQIPSINCLAELGETAFELEVIEEINRLRTQPESYIRDIKTEYASMNEEGVYKKNGVSIRTQEGISAVKEAIKFLKNVTAVGALTRVGCLSLSAQDHVNEQGPRGLFGHISLDGSDPNERAQKYSEFPVYCGENIAYGSSDAKAIVIQLLVDDGVPNRGHRTNLFRPEFLSIGVAFGSHSVYEHISSHTLCINPANS